MFFALSDGGVPDQPAKSAISFCCWILPNRIRGDGEQIATKAQRHKAKPLINIHF
jgi:hypothetical protein